MDFEPGDTALAFFARGVWRLWPAMPAVAGKSGVALRTPLDFGVFAAKAPEPDKPGVVVASPAGLPGVVHFPSDGEDDRDDEELIGGEPCFGPHPLCSRLFCEERLKYRYMVLLSGWPDECGPGEINGAWEVNYTGDCTWLGAAGDWDLELHFYSMAGEVSWELVLTSGLHKGYAYTRFPPYEPQKAEFVVQIVPCTGVEGAKPVVVVV